MAIRLMTSSYQKKKKVYHKILIRSTINSRNMVPWSQQFKKTARVFSWMIYSFCMSINSVQFSRSVVCDSLRPHELQHARTSCPTPPPGAHQNPCPLSRWCHPTISSSAISFSSCPRSFLHQGLFKWVSSMHEVAKELEFQLQHQSFQRTPRTDLL